MSADDLVRSLDSFPGGRTGRRRKNMEGRGRAGTLTWEGAYAGGIAGCEQSQLQLGTIASLNRLRSKISSLVSRSHRLSRTTTSIATTTVRYRLPPSPQMPNWTLPVPRWLPFPLLRYAAGRITRPSHGSLPLDHLFVRHVAQTAHAGRSRGAGGKGRIGRVGREEHRFEEAATLLSQSTSVEVMGFTGAGEATNG